MLIRIELKNNWHAKKNIYENGYKNNPIYC